MSESLENLAQQAEALQAEGDAQQQGGQQATPAPVQQDNGQVLAGIFVMARDLFCFVSGLKSPKVVAHDQALVQLGAQWGAVCDKHGWDLSKWMGDYAAEITAATSTIALGLAMSKAISTENAAVVEAKAKEPTPAAAEPVPDGAPG